MIFEGSPTFRARLQRYVFIPEDLEMDPQTGLPPRVDDCVIWDVEDILAYGTPIGGPDDDELVLWAILEPGETLEQYYENSE